MIIPSTSPRGLAAALFSLQCVLIALLMTPSPAQAGDEKGRAVDFECIGKESAGHNRGDQIMIFRTTIEINLNYPAYYPTSDALTCYFALHLQQIMDFVEQKELSAGHQVRATDGTINHETGEAWITMLPLKHELSRSCCARNPGHETKLLFKIV